MVFEKQNYIGMVIGFVVIFLGFFLMMGAEANTRPDGMFDPDFFNEDIFSFRRTRLAPIVILMGFSIEVVAIMMRVTPKNSKDNKKGE